MKKIFRNGLLMLAAGALAVSCAEYNETDNFTAKPDPDFVEPYKELDPVKSYIDHDKYPNMTLGATLKVAEYNKQELAHAAAMTNFDNLYFGSTLMSGNIINEKGIMNFLDMKDLLDHVDEIGGEVFGSPIAANANQADGWLNTLTAPIEIKVNAIEDKTIEYADVETFEGTIKSGKPTITKFEDANVLRLPTRAKVYVVEGFDVDPLGSYTITVWLRTEKEDKDETIVCTFADNKIQEKGVDKRFAVKSGGWKKVVIEDVMAAEGAEKGYLMIEGNLNTALLVQKVQVIHKPDNHRPQTDEEVSDTINYAINAWCDGLMKINEGRIKSFDLIEEPLSTTTLENGNYDLKHSTEKIFWQDIFGSDNYAPAVAKAARTAYEKYEGDPAELKFFINETGLEEEKKLESLKYWMNIWDGKGAKIDGINAKVNLEYSENAETQAKNVAIVDKLLQDLASTGKLIRLSNFDIIYKDATGSKVSAADITAEQRQNLANYYKYVIQSYMSKIPNEKQAGICKGNLVDTSDPVGLWAIDAKDWVRTATYKAFCDALSGK